LSFHKISHQTTYLIKTARELNFLLFYFPNN
jgi:hypothetical protein